VIRHGKEYRIVPKQQATPHLSYGIAPPKFRLPGATHVGAVRLQVSSLRRSIKYYKHVLGLRVYNASTETAMLGPQGDDRALVILQSESGVTSARRGAFGLYHFAILLPGRALLGRFAAHLSDLGVRFAMADHLVSEALYLWDPDGLGIEVYADRPQDRWRQHDRELAMTTDPLDLESLIAAGAGDTWKGAPSGTTMGHVHLHVGSLEAAEAFYHRAIGFDKTVWSYPGAMFLSAGGYHHHLGTNIWSPGPRASPAQAQLLEWEIIVPADDDVAALQRSLKDAGYQAEEAEDGLTAVDPWGTAIRIGTGPAVRPKGI
jgi:catechol 2,3-dioxygenase